MCENDVKVNNCYFKMGNFCDNEYVMHVVLNL